MLKSLQTSELIDLMNFFVLKEMKPIDKRATYAPDHHYVMVRKCGLEIKLATNLEKLVGRNSAEKVYISQGFDKRSLTHTSKRKEVCN